VDPTDEGALAGAMRSLVGNDALRQTLRESGLSQAARFSWKRTAELVVSAYRLANESASRRAS
jgi:glycosyltransferase involved in cell wall biosynthesis